MEFFLKLAGQLDGVLVAWKEQCTLLVYGIKVERNGTQEKKKDFYFSEKKRAGPDGKALRGTRGHDLHLQLTT